MARVPSAADVPAAGVSLRAPVGRVASQITPASMGGLPAGPQLGQTIQQIALREREKRFNVERTAALSEIATTLPIAYQKIYENARANAVPGGKGFFDSLEAQINAERDRVMAGIQNQYDLREQDFEALKARAATLATPTLSTGLRYQSAERKRFFAEKLNDQVNAIAINAVRNPESARLGMTQIDTAINNAGAFLEPGDAAKLRAASHKMLFSSAVRGAIEKDPWGTYRRLKAGGFDKLVKEGYLGANDILKLQREADARITHDLARANQYRALQDRERKRQGEAAAKVLENKLATSGELDMLEVGRYQDVLSVADYRHYLNIATQGFVQQDREAAVVGIESALQSGDYEQAQSLLQDAVQRRDLTQTTYRSFSSRIASGLRTDAPASDWKRLEGLADSLTKNLTFGNFDPFISQVANAKADLQNWWLGFKDDTNPKTGKPYARRPTFEEGRAKLYELLGERVDDLKRRSISEAFLGPLPTGMPRELLFSTRLDPKTGAVSRDVIFALAKKYKAILTDRGKPQYPDLDPNDPSTWPDRMKHDWVLLVRHLRRQQAIDQTLEGMKR